jgi:hypothetical protein
VVKNQLKSITLPYVNGAEHLNVNVAALALDIIIFKKKGWIIE